MQLAENCRRIDPAIIEDDDVAWEQVLETLDRWGDRKVPKDTFDPHWIDANRPNPRL